MSANGALVTIIIMHTVYQYMYVYFGACISSPSVCIHTWVLLQCIIKGVIFPIMYIGIQANFSYGFKFFIIY